MKRLESASRAVALAATLALVACADPESAARLSAKSGGTLSGPSLSSGAGAGEFVASDEDVTTLNAAADDIMAFGNSLEAHDASIKGDAAAGGASNGFSAQVLVNLKSHFLKCNSASGSLTTPGGTGTFERTCDASGSQTERHIQKDASGTILYEATLTKTVTFSPEEIDSSVATSTGSITYSEIGTIAKSRWQSGSATQTNTRVIAYTVTPFSAQIFKGQPVTNKSVRNWTEKWKEGVATRAATHSEDQFSVPKATGQTNPVPNHVSAEVRSSYNGKTAVDKYEATGNPFDGGTVKGTRTNWEGKSVSFEITRSADGNSSESRTLPNGFKVSCTHGADGAKTLSLTNKDGTKLAELTITKDGLRRLKRKKSRDETAPKEESTSGQVS